MRNRILIKPELKASFTVEAALVMTVCLYSVSFLITEGLKLHDRVFSGAAANEASELWSHSGQDDREVYISEVLDHRLQAMLSETSGSSDIEEYLNGCNINICCEDFSVTLSDKGFRPEKLMRSLTLIEGFIENEKSN